MVHEIELYYTFVTISLNIYTLNCYAENQVGDFKRWPEDICWNSGAEKFSDCIWERFFFFVSLELGLQPFFQLQCIVSIKKEHYILWQKLYNIFFKVSVEDCKQNCWVHFSIQRPKIHSSEVFDLHTKISRHIIYCLFVILLFKDVICVILDHWTLRTCLFVLEYF